MANQNILPSTMTDYLGLCYRGEKGIALVDQNISFLQNKIKNNHPGTYLRNPYVPDEKKMKRKNSDSFGKWAAGITTAVSLAISIYEGVSVGVYDGVAAGIFLGIVCFFITLGILFLVSLSIAGVMGLSDHASGKRRQKEEAEKRSAWECEEAIKERDFNEREQKRVALENSMYQEEIKKLTEIRDSRRNTLDRCYSLNLLSWKYRALGPLSYLYDCFLSGRADTLREAYDRYEIEYRMDRMVAQNDTIMNELKTLSAQIRQLQLNQRTMIQLVSDLSEKSENFQQVCETSFAQAARQMQEMNLKLNQISGMQTVTAYNSYLVSENTQYLKDVVEFRMQPYSYASR